MAGPATPNKKELLYKLLERGSVFVHLDPRREGVLVPQWLANKPQLVLQLGLNFTIPIRDLEIDDDGVRCTLSFNRSPFYCVMPWSAVYALVGDDGQVTVWPSELPAELGTPAESATRRDAPRDRRSSRGGSAARVLPPDDEAPAPVALSAARPRISLVKPLADASEPGAAEARPSSGTPQTVGDLDRMQSDAGDASSPAAREPEAKPDTKPESVDAAVASAGETVVAKHTDEQPVESRSDGAASATERESQRPLSGRKPARERPPYLRLVK